VSEACAVLGKGAKPADMELTRFRGHLVTADVVTPQALLHCA